MSYRADLRIVVSKEGYRVLKKITSKYTDDYIEKNPYLEKKYFHLIKLMEKRDRINYVVFKNYVMFGEDYISWQHLDDAYEEILLKGLNTIDKYGYAYYYKRYGEEDEDEDLKVSDSNFDKEKLYEEGVIKKIKQWKRYEESFWECNQCKLSPSLEGLKEKYTKEIEQLEKRIKDLEKELSKYKDLYKSSETVVLDNVKLGERLNKYEEAVANAKNIIQHDYDYDDNDFEGRRFQNDILRELEKVNWNA